MSCWRLIDEAPRPVSESGQRRRHAPMNSERLGHSNIGTTASIYTHGVPEADIEAARMLQDLIRSTRRDGSRMSAQFPHLGNPARCRLDTLCHYQRENNVALGRLERPARSLGNCCSVRLSYRAGTGRTGKAVLLALSTASIPHRAAPSGGDYPASKSP